MPRLIRAAVAAVAMFGFAAGAAEASVLVNKAFSPSSVALGQVSTVTVTLQNTSTASAETITAFSDDIGTMAGKAVIATPSNLSTTCAGGTPSIAGQVVSMNNGVIPIAPNSTTPGTCTVTYNVVGKVLGNGINTIPAGALRTADGSSNADPASQTLQVVSSPLGLTASPRTTVLTTQTTTQSFTVSNPTADTLTGGAFTITGGSANLFSFNNATILCSDGGTGGSVVISPTAPGRAVTGSVTGLTIPPNGSCTVTVTVSVPPGSATTTVNLSVPASGVTTNQGLTNTTGASTAAVFYTGNPNFSKSFNPNVAVPGTTTRMSVVVGNVQLNPLTSVAFTDNLPAGLTLDAVPAAAFTNCGTPAIGGAGTSTLTFSGGTVAASTTLGSATAASTCTVTVTVDVSPTASGSITNTIPAANLTNAQGFPGATNATATLAISGSGLTTTKAFSTGSAARLTPVTATLTFRNSGSVPLTAGTFTDNLPQTPIPMAAINPQTPAFTNCGASPGLTFTNASTIVNGSGLTIAVGATCTVKFTVQFLTSSPTTVTDTNFLRAANVVFLQGANPVSPANDVSANLNTTTTFVVRNYLASAFGLSNAALTVQGQIVDQAGPNVTDTNAAATFVLNSGSTHNVKLAPAPNFIFGADCPGGLSASNIVIGPGGESFTVNIPALNSNCTITYNVINEVPGATGTFSPGTSSYTSTQNGGTNTTGGANTVTFSTTNLNVNKVISPGSIASGATTTASISIAPQPIVSFPTTQANGVAFTDTLPANLSFAVPPNVVFGSTCRQSGQPAPSFSIVGSTITVSNVSVISSLSFSTPCTVSFDLTSSTLGTFTNILPAGAVTSASGSTNTQSAASSVSVVAGVGLQKTFLNPSIPVGGVTYVRLLITNSSSGTLSNGTLTDTMPPQLILNSLTPGPAQPGDPPLCGGTISGTIGSNVFSLSGLSVTGLSGGAPGRCVQYVQISTTASAPPASYVNTIPAGGLSIGGVQNTTPASGTLVITPPPPITLTKSFAPSTIVPSGTSVLTLNFANTAAGASTLTGMAVTDALPKGVVIAATPNASTTCVSGTVTAPAAGTSVALAGATIAANSSCTVTVTVTAAITGTYVNTVPAGTVTTNQGSSNSADATATLNVVNAANVVLTKAFSPTPIFANGTSTLTVTIANTAITAIALTGISVSDTLPSGVTIAPVPNASTTCGPGTVSAGAGSTFFSLAGGSVAASATCTVSVSVTSAAAGTYLNTIPANTVISDQGSTNAAPATATLVVTNAPPVTLAKSFSPSTIAVNGNSVVTVTVSNAAAGAVALTGLTFSDTLPSGAVVAASPNGSTTCGTGTVTAVPGTSLFSLTGGSLAALATCTVTVTVTGTTPGSLVNTIPPNAVTSAQGSTNTAPASATLTVTAPNVNLSKVFTPSSINPGDTSVLTISVANTNSGAIALTGIAVSDALPPGVTVAATPNASTTCGTGTVSAVAGGSSVALAAGSVAATATCTISVNVTSTTPGTYANTIPSGALTSDQGATNLAPATATLTVANAPNVTLAKAFAPASIPVNGASTLTLTIANTASGAVALTGLAVSDALPSGVTIAATPNAVTTCGSGTVAATPGGASLALAAGSVGANATCTVSVSVTSAAPGSYVNTVPASSLTSTQGATNSGPATATLTVSVPDVTILKAFAPPQINPRGTSVLTITLQNTATGAIALTGLSLTDALPAGVNVATLPNAATSCGAGTVTAAPGGTSVALAAGSVGAGATCTITVTVTSNVVGTYANTIPAGALASREGGTNSAPATATLTVVNAANVTLTKAFAPTPIFVNGTSTLTLTIANVGGASGAPAPLTALTLSDALPAGVVIAAIPNGTTTCGAGTVAATPGGASVALANGSVAAAATCTVTVDVTSAAAGTYVNSVPAGNVTSDQGATNGAPATATLVVNNAPPVTLSKTFTPATITLAGTSVLQLSISNAAAGAASLTSLAVTDALPSGVTIAATPNASTTCGPGTVTAAAGGTNVALAGGSVAAGASCTVSVSVTGTAPGSFVNTVPANAVTSAQGATNTAPATATLTVLAPDVTLSKTFSPAAINPGHTSTLTVTVANTGAGAIALTGLALTDTLPTGVTVAAVPNAATTCGTGTATAAPGGGSVVLSAGSVAAGASCTLSVSVTATAPGTYLNTIPADALKSIQGATNPNPATATLTVSNAPNVTLSKAFAPASIPLAGTSVLTITVSNTAAGSVALAGVTLRDALPTGVTVAALPNASTTCGPGTVAAVPGGTSVALAGGSVAATATCTISVSVTSSTIGPAVNTIPAGAFTSIEGSTNDAPATATLTVFAPDVTLLKSFTPAQINPHGTSVLTITVQNTAAGAIALTGLALTDSLPAGVNVDTTPNASTTCGAGTVTAPAGATSVALAGGSVAGGATCTISVTVTSNAVGTYQNTIAPDALSSTQGSTNSAPATATLTVVNASNVTLTKAFSPTPIFVNGTSTLTLTIANTAAGASSLTGLAVTDTLPAGVTIATVPNATTTCGSGTVVATAGSGSVALSGGSVAAAATCTVSVDVTSATAGTYLNDVPTGSVSSTQGATNGAPATATLVVDTAPPVTLTKSFTPASIALNGTSVLQLTIANTAAGAASLTRLAVQDTLPSGVTVAATPNASTNCGAGTVTAAPGSGTLSLTGGSVAALATCTVSVTVTGTVPGSFVNTIPAGAVSSAQGATNAVPATATLVVLAPNVTLSKDFSPASIVPTGVSTLTVTVANTGSGAVALTGLALTDTLPAGVTVATTPNAATTCGAGTPTATAGGNTLALTGGSVAAGASCTVSVSVTSVRVGSYTNTIPANSVTSTQGATNGASATAVLTVANAPDVTLSKIFTPATVAVNTSSTLTISVANTAAGAVALSGLALTDALPADVKIAATPNASTTCGTGTVTAVAGSASVALSAGTVGAGATCTISVSVTSAIPGTYVNTIAAGAVTSNQGATSSGTATATLKVFAPGVTLTKVFAPAKIFAHGTSALTISIANTATGAIALSGLQVTDTLPAGVTIATTPNATTNCGAGTVAASPGGSSVALTGGSVAAAATCTITVNVTSVTAGTYVNTIPADAVTSTQGASNAAPATATLTVAKVPDVTIAKAFAPAKIIANATSRLTISIANTATGAQTLGGVAVTDTLPSGVAIAATPGAVTTCAGTVTAAAGGSAVALTNGALAAGATCTIEVTVTAATVGTYVNAIAAGAVATTQGATNSNVANATLTVTSAPPVTIAKSFAPDHIAVNHVSRLTITLSNTDAAAIALSGVDLTDTLPSGLTIGSTPDTATTCPTGSARATAGGTTVSLTGATLAAHATCSISVNVTGATAGRFVNTIPAGALTTAQGSTNPLPAAAALTITNSTVTLTKAFGAQSIAPNGLTPLTITVANLDAGSVALSGISVSDTLPAGLRIAAPANAATTCGAGTVTALPGSTTITLSGGTLAAKASCTIVAEVTATAPGSYVNTIPVGNVGSDQGVSNPNQATASLQINGAQLLVAKTASSQVVTTGDRVNYSITVAAPGSIAVGKTTIVDQLPQFEVYAPGTARINGRAFEPVVAGRTLTWTVPALGAGITITYATVIAPGAPNSSTLTNTVTATGVPSGGGRILTGIATASVQVVANSFGSCYPITGRVYLDTAGSGRFQAGDTGVAGVRIYMEDGQSVQTDAQGRYNFPCVRPGMHALRLDETSLPEGVTPFDDRNIDSERSTRRLVHHTFDDTIIEDINFAVQGTLPPPTTPPPQQR